MPVALPAPPPPVWEFESEAAELALAAAADPAPPLAASLLSWEDLRLTTVVMTTGDGFVSPLPLPRLSVLRLRRCLRVLRSGLPLDFGRIFWWPRDPIQDPLFPGFFLCIRVTR